MHPQVAAQPASSLGRDDRSGGPRRRAAEQDSKGGAPRRQERSPGSTSRPRSPSATEYQRSCPRRRFARAGTVLSEESTADSLIEASSNISASRATSRLWSPISSPGTGSASAGAGPAVAAPKTASAGRARAVERSTRLRPSTPPMTTRRALASQPSEHDWSSRSCRRARRSPAQSRPMTRGARGSPRAPLR